MSARRRRKHSLKMSEPVTIVTHDPSKAGGWRAKGAEVAVADVHDTDALRRLFRQGQRLFLLDPPADPSTETDVEERKSVVSITEALQGSGLEKVVAESTYGAQPGERSGDLNILYEMEQALAVQPIPFSVIRAAYDMSNWDASLGAAKNEGVVHTLVTADLELPMVSPADLGRVAARLLTEPAGRTNLHYVEGPELLRGRRRHGIRGCARKAGPGRDGAARPVGGHVQGAGLFGVHGAIVCAHDGSDRRPGIRHARVPGARVDLTTTIHSKPPLSRSP